jgi:alpha-ribazole phosphatase
MKIHLIRHTTPKVKKGICYGQADLGLNNTFHAEKQQVHAKLSMPYDAIYTSPLQRCSQLADTLEAPCCHVDARLMEYNFGDWELLPWSQIKLHGAWVDNYVEQAAPGGESLLEMQQRVLEFWSELLTQQYESVAVVTHSGVQRLIHASILNTPLVDIFKLQLDFGAVIEVNHNHKYGAQTVRHLS